MPYKPDHLARAYFEAEFFQHTARLVIGKANAVELYLSANLRHGDCIPRLYNLRLRIQDLEHPFGRGEGARRPIQRPAEVLERSVALHSVARDGRQCPERHGPLQYSISPRH